MLVGYILRSAVRFEATTQLLPHLTMTCPPNVKTNYNGRFIKISLYYSFRGATNSKSLLESLNGLNGLKSAESMLMNGGLKAETPEVDDNDAAELKMREETAEKMREVGAAINLSRQQQQGSAFHDLYSQHSKSFKEVRRKTPYIVSRERIRQCWQKPVFFNPSHLSF